MLASESRFHFGPPSAAKTTSHKALAQHTSCTVPSQHAGLLAFTESTLKGECACS